MANTYSLKKTSDLSINEKEGLRALFEMVFEKPMSEDEFDRKFSKNPQGNSYHGLMLCDDEVVGAYSAIPYPYQYFGREMIFALAVDTMIHPQHRGGRTVKRMAELVYAALKADDIPFVFGFPNQNIFEYRVKVLNWHHIGDLDYFALPLHIGAIKPALAWLNPLSKIGAACFVQLPDLSHGKSSNRQIAKVDDEAFRKHRYSPDYKRLELSNGSTCFMRLHSEENGACVAYIIDVSPPTASAFKQAVKAVYDYVNNNSDVIMYIGKLDFQPKGLIKVPVSLQPKAVRFCGKVLLPDMVDEKILDIDHWQINLSNYDVR